MISFTQETLDAANREVERKIRRALEGSGVARSTLWERYGREAVAIVLACIAFVVLLTWLWWVTA